MKGNTVLLFSLLLVGLPAQTYAFDGKAPLIDGESWSWLNLDLILFVAGIIGFRFLVGKLYELRWQQENKNAPVAKSLKTENIYEPKFWYQCKNCKITVKKDSMPNSADCFTSMNHKWTELAEVGNAKFLCRNCNTLIKARTTPVSANCPDADTHNWEKLQ